MNRNFTNDVIVRLAELGLELPQNPLPPAGDYAPFRLHAGIGFLSAQTSGYDGKFSGQVGSVLTLTQGQEAAQKAALNALSRIHQALDGFDRLIGLILLLDMFAQLQIFSMNQKCLMVLPVFLTMCSAIEVYILARLTHRHIYLSALLSNWKSRLLIVKYFTFRWLSID